ncbi:hypothetical protein PaeBR_07365 [Paenibacillus sp. BR2-3]
MAERQRYNKEFIEQTVKYIQEQQKSMADIAEELNTVKVQKRHQQKSGE